ncbi:tetratricopeptide repeat protein [Parvularcula mediterranea]|nr:tetratricopeptide repeat protein [Parvularcula mediterranea]
MSAKSNVPWSVKGIDQDARSVAKALAQRRGMTLGEFITEMIREKGSDEALVADSPSPDSRREKVVSGVTTEQLRGVVDTLNRLNERLISAEQNLLQSELQSREAMGGLNQGLETMFERVKRLEKEARGEPTGEVEQRLDKLEGAAEKNSWVKSLVALEKALSTLVEQVESSREDTDERLSKNEGLIEEIQQRLSTEDEALREELGGLLEAIDSTADRLTDTDARVQEALAAAKDAAESRDEHFIERTSQKLQLLGSEIKRTSDHIRTLEGNVSRLSEKIEAGEERSAEGISRVAQSLDSLRRDLEETSLTRGPGAPAAEARKAVADAGRDAAALEGAFAAVVDRLEGRDLPEDRITVPLSASPLPEEALRSDFTAPGSDDAFEDEFDRVFEDPLKLGLGAKSTARADSFPEPSFDEPEARPSAPAFENTPITEAPGATDAFFSDPAPSDDFREEQPAPEQDPDDGFTAWDVPASDRNPFSAPPADPVSFDQDGLFREDEEPTFGERVAAMARGAFSAPSENNAALGWVLVLIAIVAIGATALTLSRPGGSEPVVMEPMPETRPAEPAAPDPTALYAEAQQKLATAVLPEEVTEAISALTDAADAGSILAQSELGEIYLSGDGVPQNGLLARTWFEQAAESGHLRSIHRLAGLDINGTGGPVDQTRALEGFTRAANAGYAPSMYNLGALYDPRNAYLSDGRTNRDEAYFWYRLAANQGDSQALEKANELASEMTPGAIGRAEGRLSSWRPQPVSR